MMSAVDFQAIVDFVLHLDRHIGDFVRDYGVWTYVILFIIVFCETGLVVTPFLPGDSLLFAAGAVAATCALDVTIPTPLLMAAAIAGESVKYWIGCTLGTRIFKNDARAPKTE